MYHKISMAKANVSLLLWSDGNDKTYTAGMSTAPRLRVSRGHYRFIFAAFFNNQTLNKPATYIFAKTIKRRKHLGNWVSKWLKEDLMMMLIDLSQSFQGYLGPICCILVKL